MLKCRQTVHGAKHAKITETANTKQQSQSAAFRNNTYDAIEIYVQTFANIFGVQCARTRDRAHARCCYVANIMLV